MYEQIHTCTSDKSTYKYDKCTHDTWVYTRTDVANQKDNIYTQTHTHVHTYIHTHRTHTKTKSWKQQNIHTHMHAHTQDAYKDDEFEPEESTAEKASPDGVLQASKDVYIHTHTCRNHTKTTSLSQRKQQLKRQAKMVCRQKMQIHLQCQKKL
jgi:hypothetical protein